jgi:anti-sigma B factor antagonist
MELDSRFVNPQNVFVLTLGGRLDAYTAPALVKELDRCVTTAPARVLVNLGNVNFIDSTGLAALVQGMKRCREHKGDLRLCGLQKTTRMIFELTRLDKAFEIFADEDQGINSFNG